MISILLFLLISICFGFGADIKPIRDVVRGYGYDIEPHVVTTSDRYKLTIHRLLGRDHVDLAKPPPATSQDQATAPTATPTTQDATAPIVKDYDHGVPVLLVEGILQSSATKLALANSIAYSLADRGFDVWLTNYRGNMYSREHVDPTLSPDQPAFWDFTLHEMGTRDLPAVIDYVLASTRREKLLYTGFSMGTTMFWIMASSMPEYQAKVAAMVAVGPVARPSHMMVVNKSSLRMLISTLFKTMWAFKKFEILPYGENFSSILNWICTEITTFLCTVFLKGINFIRQQAVKIDSAFKLIPYSPAGISTKVLIHYLQIIEAKRFQQFDYGAAGNQYLYGSPQPTEYDLKKITIPIYLVYSDRDQVATPKDIEWLCEQLPRRPERRIETVKNFRHVDFNLHVDLDKLMTQPLTSLMSELAEKHSGSLAYGSAAKREDLGHKPPSQ